MSLETALRAELLSGSGIGVGTRVYPLALPATAELPAVVYTRVSTQRLHCMGGDLALQRPRMQIDVYADTYASALTVAGNILTKLQNKTGTIGSSGHTVTNGAILTENETQSYEPDTKTYRVMLEFYVFHEP